MKIIDVPAGTAPKVDLCLPVYLHCLHFSTPLLNPNFRNGRAPGRDAFLRHSSRNNIKFQAAFFFPSVTLRRHSSNFLIKLLSTSPKLESLSQRSLCHSSAGRVSALTAMITLADDILIHVFSLLPQNTILHCRLLSRTTGDLATSLAFRHVRLEFFRDSSPFICISQSPTLRSLVREITIDLWKGPPATSDRSRLGEGVQMLILVTKAFLALPSLRLYSALQTLNIKFKRFGDDDDVSPRCRILNTILRCTMGTWTQNLHENWQNFWLNELEGRIHHHSSFDDFMSSLHSHELASLLLPFSPSGKLMYLSSLTIANLSSGIEDIMYGDSPGFESLTNFQSLTELKLLVTTRQDHPNFSEQISLPDKYDFFEGLPTTWLSPALCSNLRVLSLYSREYFGWAPKLDFRMLNPSNDTTSALPNLRVLALGKFVFCHEWQVEWIASLGTQNGRGGLQELYLDDCPIMWRAHVLGPMDESTSVVNGVHMDNSGFPLKEVMTRQSPHDEHWETVNVDYHLRWGSVLQMWRNRMTALKMFRMGSGEWLDERATTVANAKRMERDLCRDLADTRASRRAWKRRCEDMIHLNYDKPSMAECLQYNNPDAFIQHGLGMAQSREALLQYVHFHIGLGWVERDYKGDLMDRYEDGWRRYEASRRADETALQELQDAVALRTS